MGVRLSAVSMAFVVMVRKAYGESFAVGYPNLAGKANLRVVLHSEKNGLYQSLPSGMPALGEV
jgi:hypothetical protein